MSDPGRRQGPSTPPPRLRRRPHAIRPHRRVNCSEYFPLFLATLWVAGIFFHEGLRSGQAHPPRLSRSPGSRARRLTLPRPPSPRYGGPVRLGLPFRTPPLLSGLRALGAAKVRTRAGIVGGRQGRRKRGPDGAGRGGLWEGSDGPVGGRGRRRSAPAEPPNPAEPRPQVDPIVRERARALAARSARSARPARPLSPPRAARCAPGTAREAAA